MAIEQSPFAGLRELALFAGAGGGILGGHLLGWRTVCAVESDRYCAGVLAQRQNDGVIPAFPIWDDIRTFEAREWRGCVDVVSGGFPCQDISVAGAGAGIEGERSGLWEEMARVICDIRPRYAFVENSPALTSRGLGTVLTDLAAMGFDAEWGVLGAADLGAPHQRDRIWIVAHAQHHRRRGEIQSVAEPWGAEASDAGGDGEIRPVADANREGQSQQGGADSQERRWFGDGSKPRFQGWPTESGLDRVADGVPRRVDRIRALGNAQVPRVAAAAFAELAGRLDD